MSLPGNLASGRLAPSDALFDRQVRDDPSVLVALPDGQGRVHVVSIALFHSRTSLVGRRSYAWSSVPTPDRGGRLRHDREAADVATTWNGEQQAHRAFSRSRTRTSRSSRGRRTSLLRRRRPPCRWFRR